MKESTSEEHDSSTAEKKARARRAKRRAWPSLRGFV